MSAERIAQPTVLRPKAWLRAVVLASAVLFISGAVFSYWHSQWSWVSFGFVALSILGCGGVVELATTRIVLLPDALEYGSIWSRRRYSAADIASVTWEWGSGVSLGLRNGGWAKLPDLGYNSQGLANSLRAWLKRSKQSDQ